MKPSLLELMPEDLSPLLVLKHHKNDMLKKAQDITRKYYSYYCGVSQELNISKLVMPFLQENFEFDSPFTLEDIQISTNDGTAKLLLKAKSDNALVETVLIPELSRLTQCISSQVGCKMGCRFCHTGRMGFTRNLTVSEIVGQVVFAEKLRRTLNSMSHLNASRYSNISNVVFMGMGEPLDNLDAVLKSINIFTNSFCLRLSPNKITVSTIGILPNLRVLLDKTTICVALSLHSPFASEREELIPVSKNNSLSEIITLLTSAHQKKTRIFMLQYLLISSFNDSEKHAREIVSLFSGLKYKVNIIPINEIENLPYRRPDTSKVYLFQQYLKSLGAVATVRLSKGLDIEAACGQLVTSTIRKKNDMNEEI